METLAVIYNYVIAHWDDLLLIATSAVTLASLIARLTPTDKDDKLFARIANIIALNKKK